MANLNPLFVRKIKVMQQKLTFAGIDISKLTLDVCVCQGTTKSHYVISNEPEAIRTFFVPLLALKAKGLYIGMENTGCYNYHLYQVLSELDLVYYVIPPLHLKKSLGLIRGKNDKIDATRIASFLEANFHHLSAYRPQRPVIIELQLLLTTRNLRIKMKKQIQAAREQYQYIASDQQVLSELDQDLSQHLDHYCTRSRQSLRLEPTSTYRGIYSYTIIPQTGLLCGCSAV